MPVADRNSALTTRFSRPTMLRYIHHDLPEGASGVARAPLESGDQHLSRLSYSSLIQQIAFCQGDRSPSSARSSPPSTYQRHRRPRTRVHQQGQARLRPCPKGCTAARLGRRQKMLHLARLLHRRVAHLGGSITQHLDCRNERRDDHVMRALGKILRPTQAAGK